MSIESELLEMLAQRADLFTMAEVRTGTGETTRTFAAADTAVRCRLWQSRGRLVPSPYGDRVVGGYSAIFDLTPAPVINGQILVDGIRYDVVQVDVSHDETGPHHLKVTLDRAAVEPFV